MPLDKSAAKKIIPRGASVSPVVEMSSNLQMISLDRLSSWTGNPRKEFDPTALSELAASIAEIGIQSALVVRPILCGEEVEDGRCFQVIAGDRRLRASRMAGLTHVPCLVQDLDDQAALFVAIAENEHRSDLNAIDRARSYLRAMQVCKISATEVARRMNRSQPWISGFLRLLEMPEEVQTLVACGKLELGHAKALLKWREFPHVAEALARIVVEKQSSVRDIEASGLPFYRELNSMKAVRTMERYGRPQPHPECAECPFSACVAVDTWTSVCMQPDHYQELADQHQREAEELAARSRQQMMARAQDVLPPALRAEAAAYTPDESQPEPAPRALTFDDLAGDYERIDNLDRVPPGCSEQCTCRVVVMNGSRLVPTCLNGARYRSLLLAASKSQAKDRRALFNRLRGEIVASPLDKGYHATVMMFVVGHIVGVGKDARSKYRKALEGTSLLASMPPPFRALLERDGYISASDQKVIEATECIDTRSLLLHARNLEMFAQLTRAEEYKGGVPDDICRILRITPAGEPLPDDAAIRSSLVLVGDEDEDDEDIEHVCEGCEQELAKYSLGSPVMKEERFHEDTDRERHLMWLKSGVLVVRLPADGEVFYYCADCGPQTITCRHCGCTDEIGCREGCGWASEDVCTSCSVLGTLAEASA